MSYGLKEDCVVWWKCSSDLSHFDKLYMDALVALLSIRRVVASCKAGLGFPLEEGELVIALP